MKIKTTNREIRFYDVQFLLSEIFYECAVNHNEAARPAMKILVEMFDAVRSGQSDRQMDSPYYIERAISRWLYSGKVKHQVGWQDHLVDSLLRETGYRLCRFIEGEQGFYDAMDWIESTSEE